MTSSNVVTVEAPTPPLNTHVISETSGSVLEFKQMTEEYCEPPAVTCSSSILTTMLARALFHVRLFVVQIFGKLQSNKKD